MNPRDAMRVIPALLPIYGREVRHTEVNRYGSGEQSLWLGLISQIGYRTAASVATNRLSTHIANQHHFQLKKHLHSRLVKPFAIRAQRDYVPQKVRYGRSAGPGSLNIVRSRWRSDGVASTDINRSITENSPSLAESSAASTL